MASSLASRPSAQTTVVTEQDNHDESSDVEMASADDISEDAKSETELELERAVFGDSAGFRSELQTFGQQGKLSNLQQAGGELEDESGAALTGLHDADLFYLDAGPDEPLGTVAPAKQQQLVDTYERERAEAVWHDPADEQLTVSLMSQPRLRKLRNFEGEDVISGIEYQKRLRRQYEILHPRPKWADWKPAENRPRKRRRVDAGDINSDSSASEDADDSDLEDVDVRPLDELMRSSASLLATQQLSKSGIPKLRKEAISVTRMKPFAPTQPHAITSLSLHPTLPIILSSDLSGNVYVHRLRNRPVPPEPANPLLTTMHFKNIPLSTALFAPSPTAMSETSVAKSKDEAQMGVIHLSSRRRFMHSLNLSNGAFTKIHRLQGLEHTQRTFEAMKPSPCGAFLALKGSTRKHGSGIVNILSASTGQIACSIHIEAPSSKGVADFAWWSDSSGLSVVDASGEVSEFSMLQRKIIARWRDEGGVGVTTICLASAPHLSTTKQRRRVLGSDTVAVIGTRSGLVSIYARADIPIPTTPSTSSNFSSSSNASQSHKPEWKNIEERQERDSTLKPLRTLTNLTTPISHLSISPDAQLLAIASRHKRDALRLVHLPSLTVYANWPTSRTPLGRVSSVLLAEILDSDPILSLDQGQVQSTAGGVVVNANANANGNEGMGKRIGLFVGGENGALRGWVING